MDEIFEQMLSTSPWGDGIGANRQVSWDALATGSANNIGAIDSSAELQPLQKASPNMAQLQGGGLENQGILTCTMQEGNVPLTSEVPIFDTGQGHGLPVAHHFQPMAPTWYIGGITPAVHGLSSGKSDTFPVLPVADAIPQDSHHGKRPRDEDNLSLDGLPRTLQAHVVASEGMTSVQGFGDQMTLGQDPNASGVVKPRVRARRGQATDPHSIAERNRRERIAERMKALQELVPDSNKTDKASMLDEIIGYVKFLQMQVKCLSMCRLGGAGTAAPLLADLPIEGASNFLAASLGQGMTGGGSSNSQEGMAFAERQVARLMDEDMSAAMQYLQSKGLCLMPISLATAISSTGARQPPAKLGPEGAAGNMKQAMELQAAAMAAAAAAAGGGVGGAASAAPFSGNPKSQDGGSGKLVHANVAKPLNISDLQRDRDDKSKADKALLPPSRVNKSK